MPKLQARVEAQLKRQAAKEQKLAAAKECAACIQEQLDVAEKGGEADGAKLDDAFGKLERIAMDVETLQGSGVGVLMNKLRKSAAASLAAHVPRAKALLAAWKAMAAASSQR